MRDPKGYKDKMNVSILLYQEFPIALHFAFIISAFHHSVKRLRFEKSTPIRMFFFLGVSVY